MSLKSENVDERGEKTSFYFVRDNFFKNIFSCLLTVSRYLQSKIIVMKGTETHVKSAYRSDKKIRENFVDVESTSVIMEKLGEYKQNFIKERLTL